MNPILARCEALAQAGRHITAVGVDQRTESEFEARITLQDWCSGEEWLAADKGIIKMRDMERLPAVVWTIEASVEMIEDWIIETARVGEAIDWAKFERPGYRHWLTKPNKWLKGREV